MDTRHFVENAVLLSLWAMVLWRAPAAARTPRQRALWITFAALTLAMTLRVPAVMHLVDSWVGIHNLSTLVKHFLGITAAAALLEFVHGITRPGNTHGRRVRLAATLLALLALTVLFFLVPRESQAERFFQTHVGGGAATAYLMVWFGYLGTAMAVATGLFWTATRQAAAGWLRAGLRLLAVGCAAGVLYALLRAGYLLVRLLGVTDASADAGVAEVTDLLKHAAIALILLGTAVPAAGVAWRGWRYWRHLRRLQPLWGDLTTAVPEVVLDERLRRFELRLRLTRRVVEIRDALLALQPYGDAAQRDAATEAGRRGARTEGQQRVLADACWVEAARAAKLAGRTPGSAAPRPTDEPTETAPGWCVLDHIDSEARLLADLERARHGETVRRFLAEWTAPVSEPPTRRSGAGGGAGEYAAEPGPESETP